jgi:hypothetical protein
MDEQDLQGYQRPLAAGHDADDVLLSQNGRRQGDRNGEVPGAGEEVAGERLADSMQGAASL